jgi:hypothetical protein
MATALQVINRAMRLLAVKDSFNSLSAEESADSLEVLNALLAEMHEAEIGLPDYSFAELTTELASDAADREALAYALALRMAPEFGVDVRPEFLTSAAESMSRLRLRYFQPGTVSFAELPGECSTYNIQTDA